MLNKNIRYRRNRFIFYLFLDYSIRDRFFLTYYYFKHLFFNSKPRNVKDNFKFNNINSFVISLPFRSDRRKHIIKQFKNVDIPYSFFVATNGYSMNGNYKNYSTHMSQQNLSRGSLGCAISHIRLWEKLSQYSEDQIFLIFEDDIILCENFNKKFSKALINLPEDFDILYLGSGSTRIQDICYWESNNIFKAFNPRRGLYAYAITSRSARKLVKLVKPINILYGGIDTKLGKLVRQNKILAYHIFPSLVDVNLSIASNIFNFSQRKTKQIIKYQ